jgi:hypothetical protein
MKKVTKFQTSDDQLFDDENDAKTHELRLEFSKKLRETLATSIRTNRVDAVIGELLEEHSAIGTLLTNYRKRLPRSKDSIKLVEKAA